MKRLRIVWLFFGLLWRHDGFDETDNHRVSVSTAWEVAKILRG